VAISAYIVPQAAKSALLLALIVTAPCLVIYGATSGPFITTMTNFLVMLTAVTALGIFSGNSGVLSFGHCSFMALGAQISATLTIAPALKKSAFPLLADFILQNQLGLVAALIVTLLLVAIIAYVIGMAVCRLNGSSATIATLGLLIIVESLIVAAQGFTRGNQAVYGIPKLTTLPTALMLAVLAVIIARLYRDSRAGLLLRASRENHAAAESIGIDVTSQRLTAWVISAVLSAMAGVMMAHFLTVFSAKQFYFDLTFAIIVMQVVGGLASVSGSIAGAVLITAVVEVLRRLENGIDLGFLQVPQIFGLTEIGLSIIIVATLYTRREGLLGFAEIDRFLPMLRRSPAGNPSSAAQLPTTARPSGSLRIEQVSKSYGGLLAVDAVSLTLEAGTILGLIGPNGSGKTTLLGCIAGTHQPSGGRIVLDDGNATSQELTGRPAHEIARLGIGRTFQNIRLFTHLTAAENVMAALSQRWPGAGHAELRQRTAELLDELKIADLAEREAGTLAYGQQRRLEIARALAMEPHFLLLDEPAAGMNESETEDLLGILGWLVSDRGLGLLIVDHDMRLIMRLCQRIAVINKGQLIALGTPKEVQSSQAVREAYLGRRHAEQIVA
jgi:branched-chain amino acid transport system permease protein